MRVLIGCECSGVVRRAFRSLGHDAWSCDLMPAEDGSEFHFQCDLLDLLLSDQKGVGLSHGVWNLGIFHPPCDYLTVSGNRWFSDAARARPEILTGIARREARERAVEFVKDLWNCGIPRIAIENPRGRLSTLWRKPTQSIQPWQFGHGETKETMLWLKSLPPLVPTEIVDGREARVWKMPPGKTRKTDRSRTLEGIGLAMAQQWGTL